MNILNLNSYYLSSSLYYPMEMHLKKNGFEISTYVPIYPNYKVRKEITYPLPSHVRVSRCYKKLDRFIFHLKHFKIIKDFLKNYNPNEFDLLHAHSLFSNGYIAYIVNKKFNIPYMVAVRSTDINLFFNKMFHLRNTGINILLHASKVIFISHSYKEKCFSKYIPLKYKDEIARKSIVIPNGIDDFWFENKSIIHKKALGKKVKIIFVGNDSKRKNLGTLVKACDLLINKNYSIQLNVVGNITDKTKSELIDKSYINICGHVDKNRLLELYRESDIFALPSIKETFGLVYPEAMSQGLPILYSKGEGFDNYFQDGIVGYSVIPLDAMDIAKKIIRTINNYSMLSKNSLQLVEEFRWETIAKTYETIYKNIHQLNEESKEVL